ncbi:fatty acid desaturase family protein [Kordiimonas sp. SCSIO 12610]|uniref:fatty acid desaturase family protein n=1 Tax=Kordiimonas sp. SCSIO 12610 TaxID=2829597 RepID=UPI00210D10DF|nr:fatty acid desaturase family protein [Kordiimonas sp. SCSIO 12610]UTW55976.1 fatty acid desaturase family protein [Kordiimonas sp. SCSIO 12610]
MVNDSTDIKPKTATGSTQWQSLKPTDIVTTEQSHMLRQRSDWWGFYLILHAWGIIIGATLLYALVPNIFTFLIAIILIGGRQLGLAILMHEGSHAMLFKSRILNERITTWFAAWPMIINMQEYRKRHMAHHRFTRTDKDPENFLYTPFPVKPDSMIRKVLRDLTGIAFLRGQIGLFRAVAGEKEGRFTRIKAYYSGPILFNAALLAISALMGRIDLFFLMWLLPMATVQQLFVRVRNIAEHSTMPDLEDPLKNSRTTLTNIVGRATFAPYWVNYHIEHHMMPFVPCYRLKTLHEIMIDKGFGERMEIQKGYWNVLKLNASAH